MTPMKDGLSTAEKNEKSCIVEVAGVFNVQEIATSTILRRPTERQPIKYRPTAGHSGIQSSLQQRIAPSFPSSNSIFSLPHKLVPGGGPISVGRDSPGGCLADCRTRTPAGTK